MYFSANQFTDEALAVTRRVVQDNSSALANAAELLYNALTKGGVLHAFGTGHSVASALELAGRSGGLIPTNRISLSDLVLYGQEPPQVLADPLLERSAGVAQRLLDLAAPRPEDAFVIFSNSGVNASVVDMAMLVRNAGHAVVAVTSVEGSMALPSRHVSGTRLLDHADIVLDNGAPPGDTLLELSPDERVCAVSSITSAFLVQEIVAGVAARYLEAGTTAPVYISANVPGGHERNIALEADYAGRIRRGGF